MVLSIVYDVWCCGVVVRGGKVLMNEAGSELE